MGPLKFARVVVAHNPVGADEDPATADVLDQVELVTAALTDLGIPWSKVAVRMGRAWEVLPPADAGGQDLLVFNLVESPSGSPWVHTANAAALESLGLSYTGSSAAAFQLTTDKIATRAVLAAAGLPIAPGGRLDPEHPEILDPLPGPWILKPAWEDASLGLEGDPLATTRESALARAALLAQRFPGEPILVETFLPGRELNVSVLPLANGDLEILPVAEMVYVDFPPDRPRVLGYEAKWHTDSFVYTHTVRELLDPQKEVGLVRRAQHLAQAACRACGVTGYARVDLRLDANGNPCILEVNASPCIAPDAGFIAAAVAANLTPAQVVQRILAVPVPAKLPIQPSVEAKAPESGGVRQGSGEEGAQLEPEGRLERLEGDPQPDPCRTPTVRDGLLPTDRAPIAALLEATRFFNAEEQSVALELVDDCLREGPASHYRFLVAEVSNQIAGYACWGPIPGTQSSADLYWIVVDPHFQGRKVGAALLAAAEDRISREGRTRIYVETSTRPQYIPTRGFYAARGYHLAAELPDFYAPGDGKAMFLKVLLPV